MTEGNLHPSAMTVLKRYRQAAGLASFQRIRHVWHATAFGMPSQVHILTDGVKAAARLWDAREQTWTEMGTMEHADTNSSEALFCLISSVVSGQVSGRKPQGVGVIFHIADEFALAAVHENKLRDLTHSMADIVVADTPAVLVEDAAATGANAWRLVYSVEQPLAVRLGTSRFDVFHGIYEMRDKLPIRVAGVSAPLELLALAPLWSQAPRFADGEASVAGSRSLPKVVVLYYPRFTVLTTISSDGYMRELINLTHGTKSTPPTFAQRVDNLVAAARSLDGIELWLIQGGSYDLSELQDELVTKVRENPENYRGLVLYAISQEELVEAIGGALGEGLAKGVPAEFASVHIREEGAGDSVSASRASLGGESAFINGDAARELAHAARQNFNSKDLVVGAAFPSRLEIALLCGLRLVGWLGVAALFSSILWAGVLVYQTMRSEPWKLPPQRAVLASEENQRLIQLTAAYDAWKRAVLPRSQLWSTQEFISQLLPESSGVTLDEFVVEVQPVDISIPRSGSGSKTAAGFGFQRVMKLSGQIASTRAEMLNRVFAPEKIRAAFSQVGALPGANLWSLEHGEVTSRLEMERTSDGGSTKWVLVVLQAVPSTSQAAFPASLPAFPENTTL